MITMSVSICRKETVDYHSVGATAGFEGIEVPAGAAADQIFALCQRYTALCETAVAAEIARQKAALPKAEGERLKAESDRPSRPTQPSALSPQPSKGRYAGDDDRRQGAADEEHDQAEGESVPTSGRQLLGWAAKQVPDAKGRVLSFGKKKGYRGKVVDWTREEVSACYRHLTANRTGWNGG